MAALWLIKTKIDEFIKKLAVSPVKRFYPTAVTNYTGVNLKEAFDYLVELERHGILHLYWEAKCPNYGCSRVLGTFEDFNAAPLGKTMNCVCGHEFELQLDDIFPIFEIDKEYREHIKSEMAEKKNQNRLVLLR
ncbi:hypothetical protein P4797_20700 [Priestia aryabhattai]|uniref:hypothetical protein n=1 Tax=Priestia aryabhattai TaxID=412384 RepID=UPI002E1EF4A1|nr:hypothetical protein [Priestia aryabhattai]